ncbi:MAG TPA: lamin tail domain-containing protein, partial [Thermoplasmata archaeon]|nr:lamin tail domain-containing protein [Thermoplasmata archaeon]
VVRLSVLASFGDGSDTQSFGLHLDEGDGFVFGANATVALTSYQDGARMTYIGAAPSSLEVDGAFADWQYLFMTEDPLGDVVMNGTGPFVNGDVDLVSTATWASSLTAYFYMSVDGMMLGGSSVPGTLVRWEEPPEPSGSMPNMTEEKHLFGADFAYAFIDLDGNESTGFRIGGAESAVTVAGEAGTIMAANAYAYINGSWLLAGPVQAASDGYRLEVGAALEDLGMSMDEVYRITIMAQDWRGSEDTAVAALPVSVLSGSRAFGGIIINEIYSTQPSLVNDWLELYNTASYPINIAGWTLRVDGALRFTFPNYTIPSGGFYVTPYLSFSRGTTYALYNSTGALIDSISVPLWNAKSYGRTGTPDSEYDTWAWLVPTPGEINQGQIPIPEFGDVIAPLAIVPIIFIVIRRTRRARENARGDSEGNHDGRT